MAKKQFTGPDTHVSTDQTTNPGYVNAHPTGEAAEYPKYIFHKNGGGKVVQDKEEHDQAGDEYSTEPPNTEQAVVVNAEPAEQKAGE